jgi:hypothetical protein
MARLPELSGLSFARIFDGMARVYGSLAQEIQLEPPYGIGLNPPPTVILECKCISRDWTTQAPYRMQLSLQPISTLRPSWRLSKHASEQICRQNTPLRSAPYRALCVSGIH